MTYELKAENRKELARRVGELTGLAPRYLGVPSCAYQIGVYTVTKDGILTVAEGEADMDMINTLIDEGLIFGNDETEGAAEAETAETVGGITEPAEGIGASDETEGEIVPEPDAPASLHISFPMSCHTGVSLRNLLNLLYARGSLISKAAETDFGVDEGLIETLKNDSCASSVESLMRTIADYEDEHGKSINGLTMTPEELTFTSFSRTDAEHASTYTLLVSKMNEQAIRQKRIQAKKADVSNEKYAFRIWLIRLGMTGDEYKAERKLLMEKLSGHAAFRTEAEKARAKEKAVRKRDALREAKSADVQ